MSQKEAARKLGISQALLSHYEKGIRECGQDFLLRAADFYGVTCDYLLGRSTSKTGFYEEFSAKTPLPEDNELSAMTAFRAAATVRENLSAEATRAFDMFLAMNTYLGLVNAVKGGYLPKNWAEGDLSRLTPAMENYMFSLVSPGLETKPYEGKLDNGTEPPACVRTVAESVTKFMKNISKECYPFL